MAKYENQSLTRAFSLLEILANVRDPMALAEISRRACLNKATAFRLLSVLNSLGYVHKDTQASTYSLGYKMFVFGSRANQLESIRNHARPFAQNLAATIGFTIHIGALEGPQVVYLDKLAVPDAVSVMTAVGMHIDAHASALGKVLLAFRPDDEVREIYQGHPLRRHTERTITTLPALARELRAVRRRGYAIDEGEIIPGLNSVAAPIVNTLGRANVAMSVSAPATDLPAPRLDRLGGLLAQTAGRVTDYIVSREGT